MPSLNKRRPTFRALLGFSAIALTLLLLQIVQSRFFAATLTYYHAFMLISLAMLGLAAGSMAVRVYPRLMPEDAVWERSSLCCIGMGLAIFAGTAGVVAILPRMAIDGYQELYERTPVLMTGIVLLTFPPFLLGGVVVSGVLAAGREHFGRLYAIDLASAALGCVLALALLGKFTPVEILLVAASGMPAVAAALFALEARKPRLALVSTMVAVVGLVTGVGFARSPARAKPAHIAFAARTEVLSEWNATSAVRVYLSRFFTWALSPLYQGQVFEMRDLIIDGMGGTPIVQFDGHAESLGAYTYLDADLTALPHHLTQEPSRQLIIGPGGGVDVLQAVRAGRKDLTLVEINPLVDRVVNEDLKAFSGAPYRLPGVRTFIDNGRTFMKRAGERWDLVTLTWVDTGGSATALAFSENYLYTVEAFDEYLSHLTPTGVVSFLRAWNTGVRVDSMRGVSVAMEMLRRRGVARASDHILIAAAQSAVFPRAMCLVLVSREPFSPTRVEEAAAFLKERAFFPVWLPGQQVDATTLPADMREVAAVLRDIVTTAEPARMYRDAIYDLAPSTDDNPFYFVERAGPRRAAGIGVSQLFRYLLILTGLVVPFILAPAGAVGKSGRPMTWRDMVPLGYFGLLGLSFMLVEIEFFHLMTLLLGRPTLTLAVVLSSLLVFSGAGSLISEKVLLRNNGRALLVFGLLTLQLSLFALFGSRAIDGIVRYGLPWRIFLGVLLISPMAFLMGMPLPAGMRLVSGRNDLVLWGWALNGALSVFASLAAVYMAIYFGIGRTFAVGCIGYACAGALFVLQTRLSRSSNETKWQPLGK